MVSQSHFLLMSHEFSHDYCDWTVFLDLKKHHMIAVSVVAVSVMKSAICRSLSSNASDLPLPVWTRVAVDVTHADTLADQYRPSRLVRDLQYDKIPRKPYFVGYDLQIYIF